MSEQFTPGATIESLEKQDLSPYPISLAWGDHVMVTDVSFSSFSPGPCWWCWWGSVSAPRWCRPRSSDPAGTPCSRSGCSSSRQSRPTLSMEMPIYVPKVKMYCVHSFHLACTFQMFVVRSMYHCAELLLTEMRWELSPDLSCHRISIICQCPRSRLIFLGWLCLVWN